MGNLLFTIHVKRLLMVLTVTSALFLFTCPSESAEVLILVGNTKLKPVSDVISGIKKTSNYKVKVKLPDDVKDNLKETVYKEGAKAVVALGKNAVNIALSLPESIPVIYGLIISPLGTDRQNITGVYMSTPVSEYISFLGRYFPDIKKIGIICEPGTCDLLKTAVTKPEITFYGATNSSEFIEGINILGNNIDAILLLPERNLISRKAIEEAYLFSFREHRPLIGISEKYVRIGSLFSLGFDTADMGRQLGELTNKVISRGSAGSIAHSPPDNFNIYINRKTADDMKVIIPGELFNKAAKVYP
jgi:putative ABC transport system substrate-binding protein